MSVRPEYLGDGVYASHDGFHIVLRVGSHENDPVVYLEDSVFDALVAYKQRIDIAKQEASNARNTDQST